MHQFMNMAVVMKKVRVCLRLFYSHIPDLLQALSDVENAGLNSKLRKTKRHSCIDIAQTSEMNTTNYC